MAQAHFPEPPDLEVSLADRIGDGKSKAVAQYTVSNPHPGYGKDPNILNEFGHTKFPMWVFSKIENKRIVVDNEMELAQHTGEFPEVKETALKDDGPTVAEFVKAGYKASNYPPKGYASKSTQEEIDALVKAETQSPWK